MQGTEQVERTDINYLRPSQVQEMQQERQTLERKLVSPHIQDKGAVRRQLQHLQRSFEQQTPKPVSAAERDRLVSREVELRELIKRGMPSQEEMRKCPPGATDKHISWERRNKRRLTEWKNIVLRLNLGSDERDVANFEKFRPVGSTLNMDNALVVGKHYFLPPEGAGLPVVFSDEQMAFLRQLNPVLADSLALLSNTQRAQVKDTLNGTGAGIGLAEQGNQEAATAQPKRKRQVSQAQLDALARGRAARAAKKEA